ncbi:iron-siderophore ABC transporter substrate-binding protein [Microbacterium karelineae]|uniref:iron-siderophore ABC transporter substrate-binding protein n=1 Tax=Microbacterium karelineae TaxID=2654283 RepID=UPI0012EAD2CF|nr:iron-siderophore ABC transporter substrate-binding protein [Microbacterium karelineae]
MHAQRALLLAAAAATALTLSSCATGEGDAGSDTDAGEAITIEHALGTTEIPAGVERVAAIGWGNHDAALALGVAPVGVDDQTWSMDGSDGLGIYEWSTDAYAELGADEPVIFDTTDGVDFEAIADTAPDLIIAAQSGLSEEDYATLSEIAPVVAHPDIPWYTPWRDTIRVDGTALGLADEADDLVADIEQQIADATADAGAIDGKTAAFFSFLPSDLSTGSIYAEGDSRSAFLNDLGFAIPQAAIDAAEGGSFYADIAAENADQLADVDVIVSYGDESLVEALQADPLWSTVPAVENGAIVTVGAGSPLSGAVSPTALSIPWALDEYVGLLDAAAAKAE